MDVNLTRHPAAETNTLDIFWAMPSDPYIVSKFNITLMPSSGVITTHEYFPVFVQTNFVMSLSNLMPGESYTANVKSQSGMLYSPDSTTSSSTRLSK